MPPDEALKHAAAFEAAKAKAGERNRAKGERIKTTLALFARGLGIEEIASRIGLSPKNARRFTNEIGLELFKPGAPTWRRVPIFYTSPAAREELELIAAEHNRGVADTLEELAALLLADGGHGARRLLRLSQRAAPKAGAPAKALAAADSPAARAGA